MSSTGTISPSSSSTSAAGCRAAIRVLHSIQDFQDLIDWHLLPLHLRHEPISDDPAAVDDEGGGTRDVNRVETEETVDTVGLRDPSLLIDRHRVRDGMRVEIGPRGPRILTEDDHQAGAALLHPRPSVSQQ